MFERYQPIELPQKDTVDSTKTRAPADRRLADSAEVLGVSIGGTHKAYPLSSLPKEGGLLHDVLSSQEIVILGIPRRTPRRPISLSLMERIHVASANWNSTQRNPTRPSSTTSPTLDLASRGAPIRAA
jgi:hypothetical protein